MSLAQILVLRTHSWYLVDLHGYHSSLQKHALLVSSLQVWIQIHRRNNQRLALVPTEHIIILLDNWLFWYFLGSGTFQVFKVRFCKIVAYGFYEVKVEWHVQKAKAWRRSHGIAWLLFLRLGVLFFRSRFLLCRDVLGRSDLVFGFFRLDIIRVLEKIFILRGSYGSLFVNFTWL